MRQSVCVLLIRLLRESFLEISAVVFLFLRSLRVLCELCVLLLQASFQSLVLLLKVKFGDVLLAKLLR